MRASINRVISAILIAALAIYMCSCSSVSMATESQTESVKKEFVDRAYDTDSIAVFRTDKESGLTYVSNVLIIFFDKTAGEEDKQKVVEKVGGSVVGQFDSVNQIQVKIGNKDYKELKGLCSEVGKMNHVIFADIDRKYECNTEPYYPSDGYSDEWNDNPFGDNWSLEVVGAPYAWSHKDILQPISVGVIDTGFNSKHPDLTDSLTVSSFGESPDINPGHGTCVAGIIGAGLDNGTGISGIAPNAKVTGYSLGKTITANNIVYLIIMAVKDGNKVINLSIGGSGSLPDHNSTNDYDDIGRDASIVISNLLDSGYDFIVVQAAGNGAADAIGVDAVYNGMFCSITKDNCYTGSHSYEEITGHIIVVAAAVMTDSGIFLDTYSCYGSTVSLAAPGSGIYIITAEGDCCYSNGTSLSAPYVAGSAAVVWGFDPGLKASEVKNILIDSCTIRVTSLPDAPLTQDYYNFLDLKSAAEMVLHLDSADDLVD